MGGGWQNYGKASVALEDRTAMKKTRDKGHLGEARQVQSHVGVTAWVSGNSGGVVNGS